MFKVLDWKIISFYSEAYSDWLSEKNILIALT